MVDLDLAYLWLLWLTITVCCQPRLLYPDLVPDLDFYCWQHSVVTYVDLSLQQRVKVYFDTDRIHDFLDSVHEWSHVNNFNLIKHPLSVSNESCGITKTAEMIFLQRYQIILLTTLSSMAVRVLYFSQLSSSVKRCSFAKRSIVTRPRDGLRLQGLRIQLNDKWSNIWSCCNIKL